MGLAAKNCFIKSANKKMLLHWGIDHGHKLAFRNWTESLLFNEYRWKDSLAWLAELLESDLKIAVVRNLVVAEAHWPFIKQKRPMLSFYINPEMETYQMVPMSSLPAYDRSVLDLIDQSDEPLSEDVLTQLQALPRFDARQKADYFILGPLGRSEPE